MACINEGYVARVGLPTPAPILRLSINRLNLYSPAVNFDDVPNDIINTPLRLYSPSAFCQFTRSIEPCCCCRPTIWCKKHQRFWLRTTVFSTWRRSYIHMDHITRCALPVCLSVCLSFMWLSSDTVVMVDFEFDSRHSNTPKLQSFKCQINFSIAHARLT